MTSFRVLVLAAEFPHVNQPWMDTYLAQLQCRDVDFEICSYNTNPTKYHSIVDRHEWRRQVRFPARGRAIYGAALGQLLRSPRRALRLLSGHDSSRFEHSRFSIEYLKFVLKRVYYAGFSEGLQRPSVIHAHSEIMAYEFLHVAAVLDVPLVVTFHGPPPPGVNALSAGKRHKLYRATSAVFVNSAYARRLVVAYGCKESKVSIVPQGIVLENFPLRAPIYDPNRQLILLTVGRLQRDKGHRYSLLAVKRLRSQKVDVHYHVVGEGPELENLSQLAEDLKIRDRVTFHGSLEQAALKSVYASAHIFVLPSCTVGGLATETQGVVLLEALASGCLVIACATGGIPEVLARPGTGELVPQRASRAITRAILEVIDSREQWRDRQQLGRQYVAETFAADKIGERILQSLHTVAAQYRA